MDQGKLIVVLISILLVSSISYAQKKDGKERLDSLLAELSRNHQGKAGMQLHLAIIASSTYTNPELGQKYFDTTLSLVNRYGNKDELGSFFHVKGRLHWRLGQFEQARNVHRQALAIFKELGNKAKQAEVVVALGQDYLDDGKPDESLPYLNEGLKIARSLPDTGKIIFCLDILHYLYTIQQNYIEAAKYANELMRIHEAKNNVVDLALDADKLAMMHDLLGNNREAIEVLLNSLKIIEPTGENTIKAGHLVQLATNYLKIGELAEAKKYIKKAVVIVANVTDKPLVARIQFVHALISHEEGNNTEAVKYMLEAITIGESLSDKTVLADQYPELGTIYLSMGELKKAGDAFAAAKKNAEEVGNKQPLAQYYKSVHPYDSARGDWRSAYKHYSRYIYLRDSTFSRNNLQKMLLLQNQNELEKKEAIAKAAQEQKDLKSREELIRQRNIRNVAFAVIGLAVIFSIVLIRQRNKLAKEKKKSDALVQDKELLLREIHHRVKNNLEIVSGLLALQAAEVDSPSAQAVMQASRNRVSSMGIIHQRLYQKDNLAAIEMKDYFQTLGDSILDTFNMAERIKVVTEMAPLEMDIDTAVPLGLIANELLCNSLKYAFPDNRKGQITISLEKESATENYSFIVADDGIGAQENTTAKGTGFGTELVKLLVHQISGKMNRQTTDGTRVSIQFNPGD